MKKILCFLTALSLMTATPAIGGSPESDPAPSLEESFDLYVESVQNASLESLFLIVSNSESFYFLTSSGELIDTRRGYYEFHERWFEDETWEMPVKLVEVNEGDDYGHTIAEFHYKSDLPEGERYNLDSYFTLIWRKEDGRWKVIADICTPMRRYFSGIEPGIVYDSEQKYLLDTIENRRTVRKFKPTPVPRGHIMKILEAAHFAPTAGNQQPWKFLVIRNRERLDQLEEQALSWHLESHGGRGDHDQEKQRSVKETIAGILDNVLSAPVYVAVLVDSEAQYPEYVLYDGSLAAGYLMIAARALGYGTGFFTTFFPEEEMKDFFNIPDNYKLICFTPIGVPEEWPEKPPKKNLEELVVFESF